MVKEVIPIPYQVILKRLESYSFEDRLPVGKARQILINVCRIPKNLATPVFNEMLDKGWIEFKNHMTLLIKMKVDCELMMRHNVWANYNR